MSKDLITIVSGLPRSGTSMMMKMLEAGGIDPLTDKVRTADEDNPKGYYEYERVKDLPEDTDWLEKAEGKSVKVLAELVKHLPDDYRYKVIFMERHLDEIIDSQRKMLLRQGKDPDKVSEEELKDMFKKYRLMLKSTIDTNRNMDALYVSYNDIIEDPNGEVKKIADFLHRDLKVDEMISVIDKSLYRNRAED